jgi:GntR family transcriptional regulator
MNWNDTQPIYLQLRERIVAMILDGQLADGDAVPSVRQVAVDYQINPITVSRAYQDLSDEGYVEKRRGLGLYVRAGARADLLERERGRFLKDEWPRLRERIARLGLDQADLWGEKK